MSTPEPQAHPNERGQRALVSPAERRVLDALVTTDGTALAIANKLNISYNTVRTHLDNVRRKVSLSTKVELAVWWVVTGRRL